MKKHRRNSDTESYQFSFTPDDGKAMRFGEPPYSLNGYEQSSNTAGDIQGNLDIYDKNYFWINDETWDFKGPYKL